jgi:hypothetical protein
LKAQHTWFQPSNLFESPVSSRLCFFKCNLYRYSVAGTRAALWYYVKKKLMENDYNVRMPSILQPPRLELMILILAAPGMAAVSFRNFFFAGVSGQTGGAFILMLHPIALVIAFGFLLYYHVMSDETDTVMWQDCDQEPEVVSQTKIKNLHRLKTWKLRGEWVDGVVDSGALDRWGVLFEEYLPDTYGMMDEWDGYAHLCYGLVDLFVNIMVGCLAYSWEDNLNNAPLQVITIVVFVLLKMSYLIVFRPFVDPIMQTTEEISNLCEVLFVLGAVIATYSPGAEKDIGVFMATFMIISCWVQMLRQWFLAYEDLNTIKDQMTKVFGEPPKLVDDYDFDDEETGGPPPPPMLGAFTEVTQEVVDARKADIPATVAALAAAEVGRYKLKCMPDLSGLYLG